LALKTQLDIAIDMAHAMEYFHHDSFVQVVLFDLKSDNVFLDEDMMVHIVDFCIKKLMNATPTNSLQHLV